MAAVIAVDDEQLVAVAQPAPGPRAPPRLRLRARTGPLARFLAAGSGLAPIRVLLEVAVATNTRSSLTLIISARSGTEVIDRDRFGTWESHHLSFRFNRLDADDPVEG
jgi:NAD(P)H-flavin reductase